MTGARGSSDGGISEATGESDELEAVDFEAKGRLRYRTVGSFFDVFAVHKFRWYRKTTRPPPSISPCYYLHLSLPILSVITHFETWIRDMYRI